MAAIVAKRLVEHLERSGFVVMQKPPSVSGGRLVAAPRQRPPSDEAVVVETGLAGDHLRSRRSAIL
jgi:hypothetical protein